MVLKAAIRKSFWKNGTRALADSNYGLGARLAYDLWHARSECQKLDAASEYLGIQKLGPRSITVNSSQKLFILGSGESVEDLPPLSWSLIGNHYSVGLNAWPLHSFIPDAYAFEPFDPASGDYVQLFTKVLHEKRIIRANPQLLLFRPHSYRDSERYELIPTELKEKALLYGRVVPSTHRLKQLAKEIESLHTLRRVGLTSPSLVVDLGATLIRMVSLGLMLGFREIVLVGVDLNGGRYFWERNPAYLSDRNISSFSPGFVRPIHETMTRGAKAFVLTEVLGALHTIVSRTGGSIFTASPQSLLAEHFPVFDWEK